MPPVATATPLAGTTVNIVGGPLFSNGLTRELAKIDKETGIHISYREDIDPIAIDRELQDGDPPDIMIGNPGPITKYGRDGDLVGLDGYLDSAAVHKAYGDYLTNF